MKEKDEEVVEEVIKEEKYIYTTSNLAEILDEKLHTVRSWIRFFRNHLDIEKDSSGFNMFSVESLDKLEQIRFLHREEERTIKEINHYFNSGGKDFFPEYEEKIINVYADELDELKEEVEELKEFKEKQLVFSKKLLEEFERREKKVFEEFDKREKFFMKELEEKNILLLESVKKKEDEDKEELRKELEEVRKEKGKGNWWTRLFGR